MKNPLESFVHLVCKRVAPVWSRALLFSGLMVAVHVPTHALPPGPGGAQTFGALANFDVRYPVSLPNDLEIVLYGSGIDPTDIKNTWDTDILLGGKGLGWGKAVAQPVVVNTDPNSPAFGLDCLTLRYAGPARPAMVGKMVHAGVSLKPWIAPPAWEVWWTINGQRVLRPCDPKITWVWVTRTHEWVICIENPTPVNMYVYGCRFFQPAVGGPVPFLNDLTTGMDPAQFGGQWVSVDQPGTPTKCIPPWCRIYIRIKLATIKCYPIVFQIASRDLPLEVAPPSPQVDDWDANTGHGTMMIMTQRPVQQPEGDVDGDGVVGLPDFNLLRSNFGTANSDN